MSEFSRVEPEPGSTARFVVHEHYATTHHFDLRLEGAGVLWSWALPKGVPTDPTENRLAVRVEDHGLDHVDFVDETPVDPDDPESPIRKSIWDTGTYTVVRATPNKVVFDLDGERGSASYALIHTGRDHWLMHLMA
ncbi:MAG: ATP-dependent DNA ligase [Ilumatobacter sp.]|nr:ATP-dependent DNA ligase [Ilumatobacter sp.]